MAETAATTKALTIAQPWATLVAIGAKQIETRSWQTNYRGDIAIHAGKGLVASGGRSGLIELCNTMHFRQALYSDEITLKLSSDNCNELISAMIVAISYVKTSADEHPLSEPEDKERVQGLIQKTETWRDILRQVASVLQKEQDGQQ